MKNQNLYPLLISEAQKKLKHIFLSNAIVKLNYSADIIQAETFGTNKDFKRKKNDKNIVSKLDTIRVLIRLEITETDEKRLLIMRKLFKSQ